MDFTFSDDQIAFRDAVRDLLADRCTPADLRAAWEADSPWSEARWSALAEMGVIGATVPEADGGLGFGLTDVILLAEEAGRVALPEPMTAALAVVPGLLTAAGENGTKWLARLATGESVVVASLDGGPWVVGAAEADLVLVRDGEDLLG
jgi:alkylation response protein AidB-like acyl-CoA dehydrogenase